VIRSFLEAIAGARSLVNDRAAAILAPLLLVIMSCGAAADPVDNAQCGPFGDPPARLLHGFFPTFVSDHNPVCIGGTVLGPWEDSNGTDRYACLYEPRSASASDPLPLVIFLHGSLATADSILVTRLTSWIDRGDLGGSKPGFILLAPEGRYTSHYYPGIDANALGWDNWYRQLSQSGSVTAAGSKYGENADAAAIDHFVEDQVSTGKVDRKRIYVMGWSNGAAMAILYAFSRPQVAAAAVYSAPSPFGAFDDPCAQVPVAHPPGSNSEIQLANPRVPILHIRNSCDIAGICPNGDVMAKQLRALGNDVQDVILDSAGEQVSGCEDSCGTTPMAGGSIGFWGELRGFKSHVIWPKRWNDRIFAFLKAHSLPTSP
jgi:predicted esterase